MVVYLTYLQQQHLLNLVHWSCDTFVGVFCLFQGLIKIRGDKCWRELTCMDYHYEVQTVCVFAYQAVTVHKADGLSHFSFLSLSPILHPLNRLIFSSAAELCFLSSWHLEVFFSLIFKVFMNSGFKFHLISHEKPDARRKSYQAAHFILQFPGNFAVFSQN